MTDARAPKCRFCGRRADLLRYSILVSDGAAVLFGRGFYACARHRAEADALHAEHCAEATPP